MEELIYMAVADFQLFVLLFLRPFPDNEEEALEAGI
jgi:hypothetical protein